ncbi:MAG: hypothetical protein ACYDBV_14720 [Nitrospiria bacterium]
MPKGGFEHLPAASQPLEIKGFFNEDNSIGALLEHYFLEGLKIFLIKAGRYYRAKTNVEFLKNECPDYKQLINGHHYFRRGSKSQASPTYP